MAALLTVTDTRSKTISTVGVYDAHDDSRQSSSYGGGAAAPATSASPHKMRGRMSTSPQRTVGGGTPGSRDGGAGGGAGSAILDFRAMT